MNTTAIHSERFTRTSRKPHVRLCAQNKHISDCFENANFALLELLNRGFTIMRVAIGDQSTAEIEVMPSPECRRLSAAIVYRTDNLRTLSVAYINECRIVWETQDDK